MKKEKIVITVISEINDHVASEWDRLWQRAYNAHAFNSYAWFMTCIKTYRIKKYELFLCYKGNTLVGIVPLVPAVRFGIPVSSSLCDNFTVETPFLLESYSKDIIKPLFSYLSQVRNLYISKIDPEITEKLFSLFPQMFFPIIAGCPYVDFSQDPLTTISPSTLKRVKKIMRKNEGDLEFIIYDNTTDLQKYLRVMFQVEKESSKSKRGRAIFSEKITREFYKNMIRYAGKFIHIGILYYKKKPIVYQFGFLYRNIFSAYQTSYLYEYRKFDPGKTMIVSLIEYLKNKNVRKLSLGGGISTYKEEFAKSYVFEYDLYSSKNALIMFWWKGINLARRIKKILFPERYTRDHDFQYVSFAKSKSL